MTGGVHSTVILACFVSQEEGGNGGCLVVQVFFPSFFGGEPSLFGLAWEYDVGPCVANVLLRLLARGFVRRPVTFRRFSKFPAG